MWDEHNDGLRTMVRRGRLLEVNDGGPQQLIRARGLASEELTRVYRAQVYGLSSNPPAGSEGFLLSLGGRADRAMGLGFEHPGRRPTGLSPGETALYGPDGSILKLLGNKVVLDAAGKEVEVINATKVTVRATNEIVAGIAAKRFMRIREHRIDLAVKSESEEAPAQVMTTSGPSPVVWARID